MIATIEDLKKYIAINNQMKMAVIAPQIENAELHAQQFIESTLIAQLRVLEAANTVTGNWLVLQKLYDKFIANWAILQIMPQVYSSVSDAGVMVSNTETSQRTPKWAYEERKKAHFNDAYGAMEACLVNIHTHCMLSGDDYYLYVSDDYRNEFKVIFKNSLEFNRCAKIRVNFFTFKKLSASFRETIDLYLIPMFGRTYFDIIINKTNPNNAERELLDYMKRIAASGSIMRSLSSMIAVLDNMGLRSLDLSSDETIVGTRMTESEVHRLKTDLDASIVHYQRLIKNMVKDATPLTGIMTTPVYISVTTEPDSFKKKTEVNNTSQGTFRF
jgi:hypothetical protein